MSRAQGHIWITGDRRADRHRAMAAMAPDVYTRCHQRLRGPYSGLGPVLHALVPAAHRRWPELVEAHRVEILHAIPELSKTIGPPPETLLSTTPSQERTRFFGDDLINAMSHGIITFLKGYARRSREDGVPLVLGFDDAHAAEATEQEFLAALVRRADPTELRVLIGSATDALPARLAGTLHRHTGRRTPSRREPSGLPRTSEDLLRAYVTSDGTSDDPAEYEAYVAADATLRAHLHDERAEELERAPDWGVRLGAIPYHRERGADPAGAGRRALRIALEYCVATGYSAATVDFGMRGRAVTDPDTEQDEYCHFSAKAAAALIPLGRPGETESIYRELQRRYVLPQVHMTTNYGLAMLHTRFQVPPDHDMALALQNNALAFAEREPEPQKRAYCRSFHGNGLALIWMHRGNLERALELVNLSMELLARELGSDRYVLHRSQLLHNRARVLSALGRRDEAQADFTTLINLDPYYTEYHTDRANLLRKRGDHAAALADYDRAIEVSPPFAEVFYNRGDLRALVGDVDGAVEDFRFALELDPDFFDARTSLAELLLDSGEIEAALAEVRAGLELRPADPRLLCMLGLTAQRGGDQAAALRAFDDALAADPEFTAALADRAVSHYESGDLDAAVDDLTRALEIAGDDPDLLYNRGFVYQEAGRYAAAVADFDLALELPRADRAELLYRRGLTLTAMGRPEPALADLRAHLELGDSEHEAEILSLLEESAHA